MWFNNKLKTRSSLWCRGFICALLCSQATQVLADPASGEAIFAANKCGACHAMSGPVKKIPVEERSSIKGPPLWFAGSKFKSDWLTAWLEKPAPIRRVKYGTLDKGANEHPALSAEDAGNMGEYLASLIDAEMKTGVIEDKKLPRRKMFKGEKLFIKKQVCFGCHEYPSKQGDIGGFTGPTMIGASKRLQVNWVYAYLKDSIRYNPNTRMPVYSSMAHDPYTDKELQLLAQYLTNL